MRRILLALNANEVKASSIDFAAYLANFTKSPVSGIFLENDLKQEISETEITDFINNDVSEEIDTIAFADIKSNIDLFEKICFNNYSRYTIHHARTNPVKYMIHESLFADVILTDGNLSFSDYDGYPSGFVKELLENTKCPVIITPFEFDEINEIVFAYDGTGASIFAIKQFIYLFPEFSETKITLLQVLKEGDDDILDKENLKELLTVHFDAVHYDTLHGDADIELFRKFLGQRNKLLVLGAYGRKKLLSRSTADILLKTLNIPIFITHP